MWWTNRFFCCSILFLALFFQTASSVRAQQPRPITDFGTEHPESFQRPAHVVSLFPGMTEILFRLGAGDVVKGITLYDEGAAFSEGKTIVGGFFSPSLPRIEALDPDLIFLSTLQQEVVDHYKAGPVPLVTANIRSFAELYNVVNALGTIFDKKENADKLVRDIREQLDLVQRKTALIPDGGRKRVVRLMGGPSMRTPGDDSFQNELIRASGGIPPLLKKNGEAVEISTEEWLRFNPQVIYACDADKKRVKEFLAREGRGNVDAVRKGNIFYFPCSLTCRLSVHSGEFVSWLASSIYSKEFSDSKNFVRREKIVETRPLELPLSYIKSARIIHETLYDFRHKTLFLELKEPMRALSTLQGAMEHTLYAGNHSIPPPCWSLIHGAGNDLEKRLLRVLGKPEGHARFLFTGADMDNLSVQRVSCGALTVYALVTAGVSSNAQRMSKDEGTFIEPGTINIVLLADGRLTPRAMARAIIDATEAKTAALQDLDVRSTYTPELPATGTGTDEVLVLEGRGRKLDFAGGHCKLGELIGKAVYAGVADAISKQNGIRNSRSVFARLAERRIDLYGLIRQCSCTEPGEESKRVLAGLEDLLLQPQYAAFLESAFAVSDAQETGLVRNTESFNFWALQMAGNIAGHKVEKLSGNVAENGIPPVPATALDALLTGLSERETDRRQDNR